MRHRCRWVEINQVIEGECQAGNQDPLVERRSAFATALAGFDAERHGVFFLDLECPLARLPHSSYAYRSPGHRHLPGGPDLANAILLRFLAGVK